MEKLISLLHPKLFARLFTYLRIEVHFLKDNGMKLQQITVLPFTAGRTDNQHKTAVAQSMGFPSCSIFSIRALICSFFLSTISMRTKNCGQMVGLPVTLLCCLKFNPAVSSQLENEVTTLVHVCEFLKFCPGIFCILNQ